MRNYNRRAEKRISELATEAAAQFETTITHNCVHETVDGDHNRDNELLRTLDLAESAYELSDETESDALDGAAFDAAETLNYVIDELVDDQIARACAYVLEHADDWGDAYDRESIVAAKAEARAWLEAHRGAAERVGVEVAVDA